MESLPTEVLFHILSFCRVRDVLSFCATSKEHQDIPNNRFFWSLYSNQRSHPRKLAGYTPKQWVIKQEGVLTVSLTCGVGGYNKIIELKCGGRTLVDLKKEISLASSFSPHTIVVREGGVKLEKEQEFSSKKFSHFPEANENTPDAIIFNAEG
nr:F-box containing protein [Marseillevirus futianmevirus]